MYGTELMETIFATQVLSEEVSVDEAAIFLVMTNVSTNFYVFGLESDAENEIFNDWYDGFNSIKDST